MFLSSYILYYFKKAITPSNCRLFYFFQLWCSCSENATIAHFYSCKLEIITYSPFYILNQQLCCDARQIARSCWNKELLQVDFFGQVYQGSLLMQIILAKKFLNFLSKILVRYNGKLKKCKKTTFKTLKESLGNIDST